MRGLLPPLPSVDPATWYAAVDRTPPAGRPWVLLGMVATVDGATAVGGVSGPIGGAGDRQVFRALRALADVVLVGAGTARAEAYRPPRLDEETERARVAAGRPRLPRLAIVSDSVSLDPEAAFLRDGDPIVVTHEPDGDAARAARLTAVAARAEIVVAGTTGVDLRAALAALHAAGHDLVVCEGGPTLNGALAAAGLVDEVCLTVAPTLASGTSARIVHGTTMPSTTLDLETVLEQDGELYLRYVRRS